MTRLRLPTLMKYQRGSHFRGLISARQLLLSKWRIYLETQQTLRLTRIIE